MITRKLSSLSLPWTPDWDALFGTARPLVVEIGFGDAAYLIHLAEQKPDCNIIGFEISSQSMEKAERKIQQHGLDNACAVYARGETALHHLLEPESVSEFHINYPDPWFKKRHAGRRLMQRDTLDALVSRLEPGGWLYLATDVRDYAGMCHELLHDTPGLNNTLDCPWLDEMPGRIVTKYEARGYRQGRPGHFFRYQRNDQPAPVIPVIKELEMPHVILKTPMTPDAILERFEKLSRDAGDGIHISVIDAYINPRYQSILFECIINEPTIEQHPAILLRYRDDRDDYTLRYATLGMPRVTEGLHHATDFLADWLVSLHPEASIIARKTRTATQYE